MGRRKKAPAVGAAIAGPEPAAGTPPKGQQASEEETFVATYTAADFARDIEQRAQQDALAGVSTAVPAEARQADGEEQLGWCSANGAFAGLSGGGLGFAFGFLPKVVSHKGSGRFKAASANGWTTAKSFAIMGGIYAAASCWSVRIRQKQDAWNSAIAGGVSGLVLGWSGGPAAALQSAAGFAAFSFIIERLQPAAEAHAANELRARAAQRRARLSSSGRGGANDGLEPSRSLQGGRQQRDALLEASAAVDALLLPLQAAVTPAAAMLQPLAAVFQPCNTRGGPLGACRRRRIV